MNAGTWFGVAGVAGFVAGFVVCHLATRRGRRLHIDWHLSIDADRIDDPD